MGLLHEEMRRSGSLILASADANQVPAGGALGARFTARSSGTGVSL